MGSLYNKIRLNLWMLRSLPYSIYFNFKYLPFRQAVKIPIMFYKPTFLSLNGSVKIDAERISMGMIKLGKLENSLYPNSGIVFENKGGTIVFKGRCFIGNASAISVGKHGYLEFGCDFRCSTTLRLVAYHSIVFGESVRFAWECIVMDTDFHKMTKTEGGYTKGFGSIKIGKYNWFGTRCIVLKNTKTPDFCTFSACSKISGKIDAPEYSILTTMSSPVVVRTGFWRNVLDDHIEYPTN